MLTPVLWEELMQTLSSHTPRPPATLLNAWKLTPSASYCYTPSARLHQQPCQKKVIISKHLSSPGRESYSKEETPRRRRKAFPCMFLLLSVHCGLLYVRGHMHVRGRILGSIRPPGAFSPGADI